MTDTTTCSHFWLIEMAHGPFSSGVCKKCGATRPFSNVEPIVEPNDQGHTPPYNIGHQDYVAQARAYHARRRKLAARIAEMELADDKL